MFGVAKSFRRVHKCKGSEVHTRTFPGPWGHRLWGSSIQLLSLCGDAVIFLYTWHFPASEVMCNGRAGDTVSSLATSWGNFEFLPCPFPWWEDRFWTLRSYKVGISPLQVSMLVNYFYLLPADSPLGTMGALGVPLTHACPDWTFAILIHFHCCTFLTFRPCGHH